MTAPKRGARFQIPTDASPDERLRTIGWTVTDTSCWVWRGRCTKGGYGVLDYLGSAVVASRFAYETWVGPVDSGLYVCHTCDNPPCINPKHLFVGTPRENSLDASRKGRAAAKLTASEVRRIRRLRREGWTLKALTDEFGTTLSNIHAIVQRRSWKWLTDEPHTAHTLPTDLETSHA